jgi:hypothetical protein
VGLIRGFGVFSVDLLFSPPFSLQFLRFPSIALLVLVWGRTGERKLQIVKPGFEPGQPAPRPDRPAQNPVNRPQTGAAGSEAGQPALRPEQPAPQPVRPDHRPGTRLRHRLTPPPTTTTTVISTIAGITCSNPCSPLLFAIYPTSEAFRVLRNIARGPDREGVRCVSKAHKWSS